jgi:voltage-gated potassium channel
VSLRSALHAHLAISGWKRPGLSPTNKVLCGLIVFAGLFAIVSTEADAVTAAPLAFRAIELSLAIVFTIEYAARVYAAGESVRYRGIAGRLRYMLTPLALIDLVAVVPLYFAFLPTNAALLRLCRLLGILRFAKLGRYSRAMRLIAEAIHSRRFEFGLSLAAGCFVLIVSSTLLYLAQGDAQPDKFGSIPRSLWWSIVTLTTVGDGDVFPVTPIGKVLAAVTAVIGIGLIAMPTGILAAAFSEVFQRQRADDRDLDHNEVAEAADEAAAGASEKGAKAAQ